MRFFARFASSASIAALVAPAIAFAQNPQIITNNLPGCDFVTGKMEAKCIPVFVGHLIQIVFGVISVFFLINVMYAGYQMAIGGATGDSKLGDGKNRLKWSIIGLILSVCAFLILNLAITIVSPL